MKKNLKSLVLMVMLAAVLAGCGHEEGKNIKAGMAAIDQGDYEGAMTAFEEAVVRNEDMELAYRGQGIACMGLTDYAGAVTAFEKALSHAGYVAGDLEYDINYYLATAKYKMDDYAGAVKVLDGIIGMREKEEDAYLLRGQAKLSMTDKKGGMADLEKALKITEKRTDIVIDAFMIMADAGYEEDGYGYLKAALKAGEGTMSDYESGTIYYYLKDYENARNYLEKASGDKKNEKKSEDIVFMLGQTYEQLGDSNYAASLYEKYLQKDEESEKMYNQLGLCRMNAGSYDQALAAFQAGLQLTPNDMLQTLKYNEITAYEYLGNYAQAKVLMESYIALYPDDKEAGREYSFLMTR